MRFSISTLLIFGLSLSAVMAQERIQIVSPTAPDGPIAYGISKLVEAISERDIAVAPLKAIEQADCSHVIVAGLAQRRPAILGVVAAVQIPLVHFSVLWWRTLHQPPSLIRPDGPAIQDSLMLAALIIGVIAFTVVYVALMVKRIELIHLEDERLVAEQLIKRPVAGEAVTAPELGAS